MRTFLTLLLLAALTACGGGDPEDRVDATTQPVDCTTGACK